MKGHNKKMENLEKSQETMDEFHKLDRHLEVLSQGIQLRPSDEFTSRVVKGISTPVPVQIYWLETPLRAAAAILLLVTFIGLNAFSLRSISNYTNTTTQSFEQEITEIEFTMEDLGWLSADYPLIVSEE